MGWLPTPRRQPRWCSRSVGALAGALQWSGPTSSGSTGPSTATTPGAPVTRSDLVDLEIRTGRLRTVRIPTGRKEG